VAGKHGIRKEATKQLVRKMLYRAAYAPTLGEYNVVLQELRAYKPKFAQWVHDNEPEQWAKAKFRKERWRRLNSNVIESWNNWMCRLQMMPVSWLVSGHLEKLGKKFGKHKDDIDKWVNGVGEHIEQKIADTYKKMGCVVVVECYNMMLGEYSVILTNSRKLVVKLGSCTCACRKWQMTDLPCNHALVVITKANL